MEREHPGIWDSIRAFEAVPLPPCTRCGSSDTALVHLGVTARTALIEIATTKVHLTDHDPIPGRYYCNHCIYYFD
jgi:hypothetical protein